MCIFVRDFEMRTPGLRLSWKEEQEPCARCAQHVLALLFELAHGGRVLIPISPGRSLPLSDGSGVEKAAATWPLRFAEHRGCVAVAKKMWTRDAGQQGRILLDLLRGLKTSHPGLLDVRAGEVREFARVSLRSYGLPVPDCPTAIWYQLVRDVGGSVEGKLNATQAIQLVRHLLEVIESFTELSSAGSSLTEMPAFVALFVQRALRYESPKVGEGREGEALDNPCEAEEQNHSQGQCSSISPTRRRGSRLLERIETPDAPASHSVLRPASSPRSQPAAPSIKGSRVIAALSCKPRQVSEELALPALFNLVQETCATLAKQLQAAACDSSFATMALAAAAAAAAAKLLEQVEASIQPSRAVSTPCKNRFVSQDNCNPPFVGNAQWFDLSTPVAPLGPSRSNSPVAPRADGPAEDWALRDSQMQDPFPSLMPPRHRAPPSPDEKNELLADSD